MQNDKENQSLHVLLVDHSQAPVWRCSSAARLGRSLHCAHDTHFEPKPWIKFSVTLNKEDYYFSGDVVEAVG